MRLWRLSQSYSKSIPFEFPGVLMRWSMFPKPSLHCIFVSFSPVLWSSVTVRLLYGQRVYGSAFTRLAFLKCSVWFFFISVFPPKHQSKLCFFTVVTFAKKVKRFHFLKYWKLWARFTQVIEKTTVEIHLRRCRAEFNPLCKW